jgi:predicted ester cyclase
MVENRDIARNYLRMKFGEVSASLDEILSPDYREHQPSVTRGAKETKEFAAKLAEAFSDQSFTVEDEIVEGDRVVIRYGWSGSHTGQFMSWAPSKRRISTHGILIARIEAKRITEIWEEWDFAGFRAQLESTL